MRHVDAAATSSSPRVLGHVLGVRADGIYERRLLTDTRPAVVILDDFGLKPLPAAGAEDFYEVINERYEQSDPQLASAL